MRQIYDDGEIFTGRKIFWDIGPFLGHLQMMKPKKWEISKNLMTSKQIQIHLMWSDFSYSVQRIL